MKFTALLALLFSVFVATSAHAEKSWEEREKEDRCFILNKMVKEHEEMVHDGASVGNLYSMLFKFNVIKHLGKAEVATDTQERVKKFQLAYDGLDQGLFKGDAKKKALNDSFYGMHNINLGLIQEAQRNYPECMLTKESRMATTVRKALPAKAASGAALK